MPPHLGSIAEIRMGATLRGRDATRPDRNGSHRLIRIGDLSSDGELLKLDPLRFEPRTQISENLLLKPGDVLFPNRGTRLTAHAFTLDLPNVIVGAQFFVLRPDPTQLLPDYLAWFLRGEKAAAHFTARRKGTLVQVLERNDLRELPVPIPPFPTQERIVELSTLGRRERQISERLTELKWQELNLRLTTLAHTP